MEKKVKTNFKNATNFTKKGVKGFRMNDKDLSSKMIGKYDFSDNSNIKKNCSDRKLLRMTFNENQRNQNRRKTYKESQNINANIIKLKSNIKNTSIISINCIKNIFNISIK